MSKLPTKTGMKSWQCEDYGEVRAESHAHPDGWSIVVTTPVREGVDVSKQVWRDMRIAWITARAAVDTLNGCDGKRKAK